VYEPTSTHTEDLGRHPFAGLGKFGAQVTLGVQSISPARRVRYSNRGFPRFAQNDIITTTRIMTGEMTMEYRRFGRTELQVSVLGIAEAI